MSNLLLLGLVIVGQYYGQNKIQYRSFSFEVLATEHFDIHFYPGGEEIAAFAEEALEQGYDDLSQVFGVEVDFRIPAVIYNSPNDFAQTNITLDLIEEAVGGFTEILKSRMVVPFSGDYEDFRHVLVHELVHVFQFVIFFPSRLEAIMSGDLFYSIPLWVMEGSAEYCSQGWNLDADIFMRDLVLNNSVVPLTMLEAHGGWLIYKEGQAFYHFIAERYGRNRVGEFHHEMKMKKNLEAVSLSMFGITAEELNDRFLKFYQLRYFPLIARDEKYRTTVKVVFDHKKTNSNYNTSPTLSPNGDKIAFISDRSGVAEILIISSLDGRIIRRLVRSEYSSGYEGLHLYQGGLSWSADEQFIAFGAKTKGHDVLYVIDARNGKVQRRFDFQLDGIYSPRYTPDDQAILFSGLKDGYLDLYRVNVLNGKLERLTNDIYADKFPSGTVDGAVLFVSDRPDSGETYSYGSYSVFRSDEQGTRRILPRAGYVTSPVPVADSGFYFIADYDSAYNLYYYSLERQAITHQTSFLTGLYYPSLSRDASKMAFVYYDDYGYDLGIVKEPLAQMEEVGPLVEHDNAARYEPALPEESKISRYRIRFTFDYLVGSAAYYTPLGFSGLAQIGLSDILGNHYLQFQGDLYGSLTTSDLIFNYWYLQQRTDYGAVLFQYSNYFADWNDLLVWRYLGAGVLAQYPFDRFQRFEYGFYGYLIYETRWHDFFPNYYADRASYDRMSFFYPELAYVYDNARWGEIGPVAGRRFRLAGYATLFSDYQVRSLVLDARRYFRLSPRASLAARLVLAGSTGDNSETWSIGGPGSIRGYDYYAMSGSQLGFLNLEYRFPFIDRLRIAFPLPLEFQNLRGVLFADAAAVNHDSLHLWRSQEQFPYWYFDDLKLGIGAGIRFTFLFAIFRLDYARAFDLRDFTDDWKLYLTIGPDW